MSNSSDDRSNFSNVLGKLQSLQERQKNRIPNTSRTLNARRVENNDEVLVDNAKPITEPVIEEYIEKEIIPEVFAQRIKNDEQYHSAQKIAEEVIPSRPITLRVNSVFTPENMYDQVKSDYIGFIRQAINEALDAVAVFYMQGKRFAESKDLRIFLLKNIQQSVSSLKEQYVAKYPLILGLAEMIAKVEQNEAQIFRSMSMDFVNRMIANTFGN
jgi:hypothetical protein